MSSEAVGVAPEGVNAEELLAVIDRALTLAADGMDGETGPELARRLHLAERVQRRLEAFTVGVIGEARRSGAWADDGHRSSSAWVEAETNQPRSTSTAQVRVADLGAVAPQVVDQLRAGRLGVAQAREVARLYANPRVKDQLDDEIIARFLDEAAAQPYRMFKHLTTEWEALVDADGKHKDHENAHEGRRAAIGTVGDTTCLSAAVGAAQGAMLKEVLERFAHTEFLSDWEEAKARVGDNVTKGDLARSDAQRSADALVEIFRRAAGADPKSPDVEPVVNLVMSWEVFQQQLAAMLGDEPAQFDHKSMRWHLCLASTGVPVDPADAVVAALVGWVRRVVVDSKGVIINFGERVRLFRGAARQAAVVQAVLDTRRRCFWRGCWLQHIQIDHAEEHCRGGPTDVANAAPACGNHNRWKSSHGFRTWRDPEGHWHIFRPDGTEIGYHPDLGRPDHPSAV